MQISFDNTNCECDIEENYVWSDDYGTCYFDCTVYGDHWDNESEDDCYYDCSWKENSYEDGTDT